MVKCLAQGHKHHGSGWDSNPHSDDSAIRTQIRYKPLGHDTPGLFKADLVWRVAGPLEINFPVLLLRWSG